MQALNAFLDDIYHRQEILRAGRVPEGADRQERGLPARDDRHAAAGRRLHPHHRRRHRAHRRGRVLRAGGQCAHAVRRLLHAGEPRDDDAALPRAVPARSGCGRSRTIRNCCASRWPRSRPHKLQGHADHRGADARASTTPPISSTPSSPTRWACSWSKARTCGSSTAMSRCARPRATSRSTCSTAASTTTSSIR